MFYHSWRLVPANIVWGAGLLLLLLQGQVGSPILSVLLAPLLGFPTAGLYWLAALIARGEPVALSDAFGAWRRFGRRVLVLSVGLVFLASVFATNLAVGLLRADVLGWSIATAAGWGLIGTIVVACIVWPLAFDPRREGVALRDIFLLALRLAMAFPLRFAALALVLGSILVGSTIAFAALVTISVAFASLISARFVLPAADRLAPPDPMPD